MWVTVSAQKLYKSDLSFMKGVAWDGVGAPQLEAAKKAGELISDVSILGNIGMKSQIVLS